MAAKSRIRMRFTALVLCAALLASCMPVLGFASSSEEAVILEYVYPDDGDNMFSIATQSAAVDERGKYTVVVVRSGLADDAASVELKTVDVSAAYGEDYVISVAGEAADASETSGTLFEQSADQEKQSELYAELEGAMEEIGERIEDETENSEASEEALETPAQEDEAAEGDTEKSEEDEEYDLNVLPAEEESGQEEIKPKAEKIVSDENDSAETPGAETETESGVEAAEAESVDDGKSDLAKLKEAQTGKPTRETSQTEFTPIHNLMLESALGELSDNVETSSTTTIEFLPGETEKYVTVEIIEDDISEGDEVFDLMLGEASEGYSVGAGLNCSITITDDEPTVYSKLGFSEAEYTADGSKAVITVTRSGAEYSFCTAVVKTVQIENSAVVSQNFSKVEAEIAFSPYETEYTFEIPTRGGDNELAFELELSDIKGAEGGDFLKSTVKIPSGGGATLAEENETVELAEDSDSKSFSVNLDNKTYTVKYKNGDSIGGIYDTDYNPEVRVGDYYFTKNAEYGIFTGSDYWRRSYFEGENNRARLFWYDWRTWKNGSSDLRLPITGIEETSGKYNSRSYQYIAADWEQTKSIYGGQLSTIMLDGTSTVASIRMDAPGQFNRQTSPHIVFLDKNKLPTMSASKVKVMAVDKESNMTPQTELFVYGVAAMYRKFNVTLAEPNKLSYKTADGGEIELLPAAVVLGEGHGTRYAGQSIQMDVRPTSDGEPIKGQITGYKITIGTSTSLKTTIEYTPKGDNKQSITLDEELIALIDKNTKQVSATNDGYSTDILIQPIFDYINTEVEVVRGEHGKFSDSNLTVGKHTYHVGDTIRLNAAPDSAEYYYIGYSESGYKNASDTQPVVEGDMTAAVTDLKLTLRRYVLKPLFNQQQNHIRVRLSSNAEGKVRILNTVPEDQLSDALKNLGGYVLNTSIGTSSYSSELIVGKVYQIQAVIDEKAAEEAAARGKVLRPVFTQSSNSEVISGNAADVIAKTRLTDNEVTVDVVETDANKMSYFKLSGQITVPGDAIRSSAFDVTAAGARGVTIMAGAVQTKAFNTASGQEIDIVDRRSAVSGENGTFEINGIYAADGETITLNISNGDVESVAYFSFSTKGLTTKEETYFETVYDENTHTSVSTQVTRDLSVVNADPINMPIRTPLAPYVSSVDYTVDQIRDYTVDTRNNAVPILATQINISAGVNLNNRELKAAVFTIVSKNGARKEKRVEAAQKGQIRFTATYQMDTELSDGDMLYISLIDKEDRVVSYDQVETKEERRYADVFTGLTFYVPELEIEGQKFEFSSTSTEKLPILGELAPSVSADKLTFKKQKLGDSATAPYYLQFIVSTEFSEGKKDVSLEKLRDKYADTYGENPDSSAEERKKIKDNVLSVLTPRKDGVKEKAFEDSLSELSQEVAFSVQFTVMFSFYFTFVQGEDGAPGEYKMALGQYFLGTVADLSKTFYWVVYGVPLFVKLSGEEELDVSGNWKSDAAAEINDDDFKYVKNLKDILFVEATPEPSTSGSPAPTLEPGMPTPTPQIKGDEHWGVIGAGVKIVPGVGLCGTLAVRGVFEGEIAYRFNLKNSKDGFLWNLSGGVGVDLILFSFDYTIGETGGRTGAYKKDKSASLAEAESEGTYEIRQLERGNSDLNKFGQGSEVILADDDFSLSSYQILSENTAERTNPQITTLNDGRKILFFIDNDPSREAMDAMCLYYSICSTDGVWSEPQKVDDNGTADADPVIVNNEETIFVFWSDANKTFGAEAEEKEVLSSMEIACRMIDPISNEMGEKEVITSDGFLDSDANIGYDEETATLFCYYLKQDIDDAEEDIDLIDVNATYSTIACRVFKIGEDTEWSPEYYIDIPHEVLTDPLILDFDTEAANYNGEVYSVSTYTVDEDNNLATSEDREAYLLITNLSTGKAYYPIRLTNDDHADISPKLTYFNGELLLTWVNDNTKFTTVNISNAVTEIENAGLMESMLNANSEDPDWYKIDPSSVDEETYYDSIFYSLTNADFENSSVDFSNEQDGSYFDCNIGSYELYNNNNNALYLIWNDVDTNEEDDGVQQEIYGAVYQKSADLSEDATDEEQETALNEYSSWGRAIKLTDFDKMMDEFTVTFDEDETMYLCSNMFEQWINDEGRVEQSPNSLAMTTYKRGSTLELDDEVEFDSPITPGTTTNLIFDLKNNGMLTSNGAAVKVVQIVNGAETVVYEQSGENKIISGDSVEFTVPWEIPESLDGLELAVEYSEVGHEAEARLEVITPENKSDVVANEVTVQYNSSGVPMLTAELENIGAAESAEIKLTVRAPKSDSENSKTYGTFTSEALAPNEIREVEFELPDFGFDDLSGYGIAEIMLDIEEGNNASLASAVLNASATVDIVFDCENEIAMTAGETKKISASAMPENASDREIVYSSSDAAVANISEDGTITAIGNGTAEITAYNPSSTVKRSITVTVTGGAEPNQRPSSGGSASIGNWSTGSASATPMPTATPDGADTGLPFTDVSRGDWFYDAVKYVYDNGLFKGTSDTLFEPDAPMTRGMFATVLGRAAGVDASAEYENVFADVEPNEYYAPYIAWASENGMVEGNGDGTFAPDDNITREQMAKIFLGYYRYMGEGPEGAWAIALNYADVDQMSDWALEGVMFCTLKGLLMGKENNMFDPKGNALRSEVATVLMRAGM